MTCEQIDNGRWRLTFAEPEAAFLMNVLARLARHYRDDLDGVSPAMRDFWRTGASVPVNDAAGGESRDVLAESREELRSERCALAEAWLRDFELAEEPWVIDMTTSERDEFVAMLNDRRLILAVETGVVRQDNLPTSKLGIDGQRAAILEIDVLGHFIMVLLGPQIHRP
jgi:hypothetical protein